MFCFAVVLYAVMIWDIEHVEHCLYDYNTTLWQKEGGKKTSTKPPQKNTPPPQKKTSGRRKVEEGASLLLQILLY